MTDAREHVKKLLTDLGVRHGAIDIAMREIDALVKLYCEYATKEGYAQGVDEATPKSYRNGYNAGYSQGYVEGRQGYQRHIFSLSWIPEEVKGKLQNLESDLHQTTMEVK